MFAGFVEVLDRKEILVGRVVEVVEREETLGAEACNHPNLLVIPFRAELIRFAA